MAWDQAYRRLEEGEIILSTDEVYNDVTKTWHRSEHCVGKPAPNPNYTSHRTYRRLKEAYLEYDDIPDTPEQRALIATHNAKMKELYPDMVEIKA